MQKLDIKQNLNNRVLLHKYIVVVLRLDRMTTSIKDSTSTD